MNSQNHPLKPLADELMGYCQKEMGFQKPPSLFFQEDPENAKDSLGKTAYYDPSNLKIVIYTTGRHDKDILRSIAHELVHHVQNLRGDFDNTDSTDPGYAQNDPHLRNMEKEAYLLGNMLFRDWEDQKKSQNLKESKIMNKDQLKEMIKGYLTDILNEKAQKPDFPDVDGDGDRTEPISKASKEKKGDASDDDKPKKKAKKGEIPPQLRDHVKGKQAKKKDKEQVDEAKPVPLGKDAIRYNAKSLARTGSDTDVNILRGASREQLQAALQDLLAKGEITRAQMSMAMSKRGSMEEADERLVDKEYPHLKGKVKPVRAGDQPRKKPKTPEEIKGGEKHKKNKLKEAESTNIDEYSNHPLDKFAEKTVAPAMRTGANATMGVVRGITGAVKGLGQGLRGDEDEVEEGILRDLGNAVVDGAKGVYGAGEDVVDAFGSFKKTPSITGALKGAAKGAFTGAKKGFDTFKHRDKDGNLKEEELEEGGKALRTGNEDRFSGNEDKFSTDRVHEVEDVDEAHHPGHKEDKKKMKESDEIEEGSCGSYSRDDEMVEELENIQTPEQENALYEARFSNRNEKLFKKLLGKWAK